MGNRIKKYNPAFLSPEELMRSFVVRHAELELIVQVIRENTGESNQHVLVIGPRGIGKTMLVLRVVEEIRKEKGLGERWYPLVFSEESYPVITPGEFWLEALFHLAHRTKKQRWVRTYEELRDERDEERLRERALAQLMDFADAEGKRILLVVENFNMLLGEQISDSDAWKLRHTLLHEPRVMLVATATTRFEEIESDEKAMFELFKLHELQPLDEGECGKLWASVSGKEASDERVRPLQILTGGNPRLLAIISTFAAKMSLKELMDDLMQLVDDNTEYFKSHLDSLPAIERKVYLALAELWNPVTAREVAAAARLGVSKSSALLRRLMERGMVVQANGERRAKLYQVAERMYNIYYLMRRRGAPSRRVKGLVRFMVPFYGAEELVSLTRRIAEEACKLEASDRKDHYLAYEGILESISTGELRKKLVEAAPSPFFRMVDVPTSLKGLADERLLALLNEADALGEKPDRLEEAEHVYRKATEIAPESGIAWASFGEFLQRRRGCYNEAEKAYRKAIESEPDFAWGWAYLGCLLHRHLGRYEEAENAYRKAIDLRPEFHWAWEQLGDLLGQHLKCAKESEKAFRRAIELGPDCFLVWTYLGRLLHEQLGRYEEAEEAYQKSIELKDDYATAWVQLGSLLHRHLGRYEEAEKAYRKAIELRADYALAWEYLGLLLHGHLERYEEAEAAYRQAVELNPQKPCPWVYLGMLLQENLKHYEKAEAAYRKAIEQTAQCSWAWSHLGYFLYEVERHEEAEKAFQKALDTHEEDACAWSGLLLLQQKMGRSKKALELLRSYLEKTRMVERSVDDVTELLVGLAASGQGADALEVLRESPSAEILEPLVVGLRMYVGEDVKVAAEIMEVGKDVVKRIEQRRKEMRKEKEALRKNKAKKKNARKKKR